MRKLQKCLIKVVNKHYNNALMMIKKEDHNTGVNDDFKKFLMEKLIKNLTNGALSRNLIKSIKILSRILKTVPYQGT